MTYILLRDICHSQRLPFDRIQRADKLGEIELEEDPAPAGLRPGDEAAFRAHADFFGMHMEECGGLVEIERFHRAGRYEILRGCNGGRVRSHPCMAMPGLTGDRRSSQSSSWTS
jgi:hypothetical protein